MKNQLFKTLVSFAFGAVVASLVLLSFFGVQVTSQQDVQQVSSHEKKADEPLYWVAPMDANYRRDKPGKSPMGMDLVPVYPEQSDGDDEGVGTIRISPNIVNNLGVRTVIASVKSLQSRIETVGYIRYDENLLVHIHPRVDGWIEKLYVNSVGDPVEKGQALYQLYSPELVNAQEELLLAIERNNKRLIRAAENRLRALQLPDSAIQYVKNQRKVQQTITFYAPQKGVVENLNIREGFFVNPGATLMSIGDLSQVWVEAEVFERQTAYVKTGALVDMTLDYLPGKTWQGQVDYIYPTLDSKTRTIKVRLKFTNEHGLFKPNMFAQITIHGTGEQQALLIPKEALIRTGNQDRIVLALGDGKFKSIAVSVGRFDNDEVEILSGLNAGEKVVSSAQFLLDSESSKSSDFKRMSFQEETDDMPQQSVSRATVTGTVNSVMLGHRMLNISRSAIDKWQRPAATMDFIVADDIDMAEISQGMVINFTFEVHPGVFLITNIESNIESHIESDLETNSSEGASSQADDTNHSSHQQ